MTEKIYFKCECGSTIFRIRMDHDWETPVTNPKTGEDDMECGGSIECAYCGKNFMELGR